MAERPLKAPMPPRLALIAAWMPAAVAAPRRLVLPTAPWQPAQLAVYRSVPVAVPPLAAGEGRLATMSEALDSDATGPEK